MNEQKIIIGLTGFISAGKGTVAKYLEEQYGAQTFRFSTILRDILDRLYTEKNRENLQELSTVLRKQFGEDILSKVIACDVANSPAPIVIVDGVRRLADITYLKAVPGFCLVKITASPEIRYQRLIKRSENPDDKNKTFEEFQKDMAREADAEIPFVMENVNREINNEGTYDELYQQIDKLLEELKK